MEVSDADLLPTGAKVRRRDDWSRRGIVVENAESRNVIVPKGWVIVFWTSGNQIQTKTQVKELECYGVSYLSVNGFTELRLANFHRQQEWDPHNKIRSTYRGNELAGEVGEACNVIKKLEREKLGIRGSRDTKEHLAEELADVIVCVDLIAMDFGIDLWTAVREKFNATSEKVGLKTRIS